MSDTIESCNKCKGLGVIYIGITNDERYWKTCDCPECSGTGITDKEE